MQETDRTEDSQRRCLPSASEITAQQTNKTTQGCVNSLYMKFILVSLNVWICFGARRDAPSYKNAPVFHDLPEPTRWIGVWYVNMVVT